MATLTAPMLLVCPYGHRLGPGRVLVGWAPCQCPSALKARHGRGHKTVCCRWCLEVDRVTTVRYEPYHVGGGHPRR